MTVSESAQWRQAAREEIEAAHRKQKLAEDSREALRRKLERADEEQTERPRTRASIHHR